MKKAEYKLGINHQRGTNPFCGLIIFNGCVKAAATDVRYFVRSRLPRSLGHKKNAELIWQVALKLKYLFCQGR